jgi:hypothetical protein
LEVVRLPARGLPALASSLSERLASTWILLSDTTNFLSRTSVFPQYEAELMEMRRRLTGAARKSEAERGVRADLTELRKALRLQGYDLSLGKLELAFQGWRNDAAEAEGFRRLVLFLGARNLWFASGEENHLVLHDRLDTALRSAGIEILQKHYLWYRWNHGQLILSASDTEGKDDFEELKTWSAQPERRLFLLSRLKKLQ